MLFLALMKHAAASGQHDPLPRQDQVRVRDPVCTADQLQFVEASVIFTANIRQCVTLTDRVSRLRTARPGRCGMAVCHRLVLMPYPQSARRPRQLWISLHPRYLLLKRRCFVRQQAHWEAVMFPPATASDADSVLSAPILPRSRPALICLQWQLPLCFPHCSALLRQYFPRCSARLKRRCFQACRRNFRNLACRVFRTPDESPAGVFVFFSHACRIHINMILRFIFCCVVGGIQRLAHFFQVIHFS